MTMNANELMMLTEDQINFESLSIDILKSLALGDELFIATSALAKLNECDKEQAEIISWTILSKQKGDSLLQALALEVMFNCNPDKAISFINAHWETMDNVLRGTVEDIIMENNLTNLQRQKLVITVS
jgi:hypothetical protein